jgi:hypothetical protein
MEADSMDERVWWWELICKLESPLKTRIFLWITLSNKILTWDDSQKRNWNGPGRCVLCKEDSETDDHLFVF